MSSETIKPSQARDFLIAQAADEAASASQAMATPGISNGELKKIRKEFKKIRRTLKVAQEIVLVDNIIEEESSLITDGVLHEQATQLDAIPSVDQPPTAVPIPDVPERKTHEPAKRGDTQRRIILAFLSPNEDRTNFRYTTAADVTKELYGQNPTKNHMSLVYVTKGGFIKALHSKTQSSMAKKLIDEIHQIPEYATATNEDIEKLLKRQLKFPSLKLGEDKQTTTNVSSKAIEVRVVDPEKPVEKREPRIKILPDAIPSRDTNNHRSGIRVRVPAPQTKNHEVAKKTEQPPIRLPELQNTQSLEVLVAMGMLLANDSGTDYRYATVADFAQFFPTDQILDKFHPRSGIRRLKDLDLESSVQALQSFSVLLKRFADDVEYTNQELAPVTAFISWTENQRLYWGYGPKDFIKILNRQIDFREVLDAYNSSHMIDDGNVKQPEQKPESEAKFDNTQRYLLAQTLYELEPKKKRHLGIEIKPEDKDKLSAIMNRIRNLIPDIDLQLRSAKGPLYYALKELFKNPSELNKIRSDDTKFLLEFIMHLGALSKEEFIRIVIK